MPGAAEVLSEGTMGAAPCAQCSEASTVGDPNASGSEDAEFIFADLNTPEETAHLWCTPRRALSCFSCAADQDAREAASPCSAAQHVRIPHQVDLLDRVEALSSSPSQACQSLLAHLGRWEMDTLSMSALPEVQQRPLSTITQLLFKNRNLPRRMPGTGLLGLLPPGMYKGDPQEFMQRAFRFVEKLESVHGDVPYHSSSHAADIMCTMEYFMESSIMESFCGVLDHTVALLVAASHDVGHPGTNNSFQINSRSPIALQYDDKSPLENMHIAIAFEIMNHEQCRWIGLLEKEYVDPHMVMSGDTVRSVDVMEYVRRMMVSMVLSTDPVQHPKLMQRFDEFLKAEHLTDASAARHQLTALRKPDRSEDKQLVLDTLLHLADVSNPCKLRPLALHWTKRLFDEFWAQGDQEAKLGLPISPMCDRTAGMDSLPQTQLGFIDFVVGPAYTSLSFFIIEAEVASEQLRQNREFWERKKAEGASYTAVFAELRDERPTLLTGLAKSWDSGDKESLVLQAV